MQKEIIIGPYHTMLVTWTLLSCKTVFEQKKDTIVWCFFFTLNQYEISFLFFSNNSLTTKTSETSLRDKTSQSFH